MESDIQSKLHEEMRTLTRPPLGDVVGQAITRGGRIRRVRRSAGGVTSLVAVAAIASLVAVGHNGARPTSGVQIASAPASSDSATPAPAGSEAVSVIPTNSPPPPGVPATTSGMAELLTQLLPAGRISYLAQSVGDRESSIEAYLGSGADQGMIRIFLGRVGEGAPVTCSGICTVQPNGDGLVVNHVANNCTQTDLVAVEHPDGSYVYIDLATGLATNGSFLPVSPPALTVAQAIKLVSDPRWETSMSPDLVASGAKDFPTLPNYS